MYMKKKGQQLTNVKTSLFNNKFHVFLILFPFYLLQIISKTFYSLTGSMPEFIVPRATQFVTRTCLITIQKEQKKQEKIGGSKNKGDIFSVKEMTLPSIHFNSCSQLVPIFHL